MTMEPEPELELEGDPAPPPTPSFKGRLKLADFMFQGDQPSPGSKPVRTTVRRSPRLADPAISAETGRSPSKGASQQPWGPSKPTPARRLLKRKASSAPASSKPGTSPRPPPAASAPLSPLAQSDEQDEGEGKNKGRQRARKRARSGYAPPLTYAHLPHLPDAMAPGLLVLFVGLNPGLQTARTGHAYAHPSNLFWKLLASSGVTPLLCRADEDRSMPARFALGLTNIVARPSRNGAELSRAEMDDGVAALEAKSRRWRPESVCIVGKSIWESVWRVRHGRSITKAEFRYGWQDLAENMGLVGGRKDPSEVPEEDREPGVEYRRDWAGARVFVASSTSGLAASLLPAEKERIWRELGVWVEQRRSERKAKASTATAPG